MLQIERGYLNNASYGPCRITSEDDVVYVLQYKIYPLVYASQI